jgi:hypothetical protein
MRTDTAAEERWVMATERYSFKSVLCGGDTWAAVIDHGRGDQIFCLVDPRDCNDSLAMALARAHDIADMFNHASAEKSA